MSHATRNAAEAAILRPKAAGLLVSRSIPTSRPTGDPRFDEFAATLRCELDPRSAIETLLVDRVVLAAWRLHLVSLDETNAAARGETLPALTRDDLRAEKSLETALGLLEAARSRFGIGWGSPAPEDSKAGQVVETDAAAEIEALAGDEDGPFSNEWPTLPDTDAEFGHDEQEENDQDDAADVPVRWQDRLVFDENVSDSSPVVKGTWVTVRHVVSLIVDGWLWSDILRTHPELTEDDIRTCLAYTVEQDDRGDY